MVSFIFMKRMFFAFSIGFLLLELRGGPFELGIYNESDDGKRLTVHTHPHNCIDRFDTCYNLCPLLYLSYSVDNYSYAFVIEIEEPDKRHKRRVDSQNAYGVIFKPNGKGKCFFSCGEVEIIKTYNHELTDEIKNNLSDEDRQLYENGFEILEEISITVKKVKGKDKKFTLIINLLTGKVTYARGDFLSKGTLTAFGYL